MAKKKKKESTLYYFSSPGCAFCKQLTPIIEKLNGEGYDILSLDLSEEDNKGLKQEIENKYNLRCGTPWLVDASNGNHICGYRDEENVKKWADGEEVPAPPQPKGPPPPPPKNFDDDDEIKDFTEKYNKWKDENNHLPNLQNVDVILTRFKQQKQAQEARQNGLDGRVSSIEQKLDRLMNHLGVK
jgi:thiol-disulfide isomerase/thioredoxin